MMFTPCWPSAGPTGGAGFALPAGIWSLTIAWIFFISRRTPLEALHLVVLEINRGQSAEEPDHHLQPAALRIHVLNRPREVDERPLAHAHLVALGEDGLRLGLLGPLLHLAEDFLHFFRGEGNGPGPRSHEPRHLRGAADEVPCFICQLHLDQDISGIELLGADPLLALADLHDLLHGHHDPGDVILQAEDLGALLDRRRDLVLEPRVGVHDEPLLGAGLVGHLRTTPTIRASPRSATQRKTARTPVTTSTTAVELTITGWLGQFTFRNPAITPLKNCRARPKNSKRSALSCQWSADG